MPENKKINTIIFVIAASVVNLLLFIIFFIIFMTLFIKFVYPYLLSESGLGSLAMPLLGLDFLLSLVCAFLVYRTALNIFLRKYDMDKYFEPLFSNSK